MIPTPETICLYKQMIELCLPVKKSKESGYVSVSQKLSTSIKTIFEFKKTRQKIRK